MTPKEFLDALKDRATDEVNRRAYAALASSDSEVRVWLQDVETWARTHMRRVRRPDHLLGFDIDTALEEVALRDPQLARHINRECSAKPDELVARLAEFCRGTASPEAAASLAAELQDRGSRVSRLIRSVAVEDAPSALDQADTNLEGVAHLTRRELEILRLLANGESIKRLAEILGVSMKTIDAHIACLTKKLGLHDNMGGREPGKIDLAMLYMKARKLMA